jgi:hypothetical protein
MNYDNRRRYVPLQHLSFPVLLPIVSACSMGMKHAFPHIDEFCKDFFQQAGLVADTRQNPTSTTTPGEYSIYAYKLVEPGKGTMLSLYMSLLKNWD